MVTKIKSEIVARIFEKKPRIGMAPGFLTIKIQSARFSKIRKFVPLIIFNCEPIFHVIRVLNFYICQKTVPAIFEKKPCVDITSVSLKIHLESRKWPHCPAPGAPGVAKSRRSRVNYLINQFRHGEGQKFPPFSKWLKNILDTIFSSK